MSDYRRKVADYKKNQKNEDAKAQKADGSESSKQQTDGKVVDKKNDAADKTVQDSARSDDGVKSAGNGTADTGDKTAADAEQKRSNSEKSDTAAKSDKKASAPAAGDKTQTMNNEKSEESPLSDKSADAKKDASLQDQNAAEVSESKGQTVITIDDDKDKTGADVKPQSDINADRKVEPKNE